MTVGSSVRTVRSAVSPDRHADAELTVDCFGVGVRICCNEPDLLAQIRDRLPPGNRASRATSAITHSYSIQVGEAGPAGGGHYCVGYAGMPPFTRTSRVSAALAALESTVRIDVAAAAREWYFVHAGAVGWHGRAVVIPAPSRHGKSRLVEALVRAGASYYSDEFAVLDPYGRVHPFAKPLNLRSADEATAGRRVTAEDLGGVAGTGALPIGLVVVTRYRREHRWQPREATRGEGVVAMLANAVQARSAPGPLLRTLALALDDALVLDGTRGEAGAMASTLLSQADAHVTNQLRSGGHHAL